MSGNPYQPPAHPGEDPLPDSTDPERLEGIARLQRWVNFWVMVQIPVFLLVVLIFVEPIKLSLSNSHWFVSGVNWIVLISYFALWVENVRLAHRCHGLVAAIPIGIFSMLPLVGFVPGLVASFLASRILKGAGFKVGLLGVNPREIQRAIDEGSTRF